MCTHRDLNSFHQCFAARDEQLLRTRELLVEIGKPPKAWLVTPRLRPISAKQNRPARDSTAANRLDITHHSLVRFRQACQNSL
jgi:hypothetical protein